MIIINQTLIAMAVATTASFSVYADKSSKNTIEEVIVTAQKRAQSVNDIGVTITTFGAGEIKELGFESAKDIAQNTPGLSSVNSTSGGTPIFAIRGVGLDDFNSNNTSGVGVYLDEVLAAYPVFLNGKLFDVERVEVLKGPQGTLYGKNTTGGAINFVSVKPSDEFEGYVTAGFSRWNTRKLEGAVNLKMSDSVNSRLAFTSTQGDGWQEDINTGKAFGEPDVLAIRSLTAIELSDGAELLLNLHYTKDDGTPLSPQNSSADLIFGTPQGTVGTTDDPTEVNVGALGVSRDEEGIGASAILTVDFDAFTLTSISAFDKYSRHVVDNFDGQPLSTDDIVFKDKFDVFSQELRLTSNNNGAFHWVAGVGYSYEEVNANTTVIVTDLIAPGITALPPFGFGIPISVDAVSATANYQQDTTSFGAYLHTETDFSEDWKLTAGLRFSYDKRDIDTKTIDNEGWLATFQDLNADLAADFFDDGLPNGSSPITFTPPVGGQITGTLKDDQSDRNWSGKIGLDYTINEDWLLYSSIANSYKAGIYYGAPAGSQEAASFVEPEEVLAYELGFKGAMLDNTLQLNGSAYLYRYDDRQTAVTVFADSIKADVGTLANIEESEINGAELELRWLPAKGLDVRAGVSYIDGKVTKSPGATVRELPLSEPIPEGARLAQAPKWSYNIVGLYEWSPVDGYMASAMVNYSWTDEQYSSLGGDSEGIYGEVDSLRLRFSVRPDNGKWSISAWVDNLENQNANTFSFVNTDASHVVYYQQPRNYGVDISYNF